jgi:predicted nucleic acid-binding protein
MMRMPLPFCAAFLVKTCLFTHRALTELELFADPNLSTEEESLIEELLATISVIPVDSRIARLAALVRRDYRLKVPDSVIAATALFTGSKLLTRNHRDFRKVSRLTTVKI